MNKGSLRVESAATGTSGFDTRHNSSACGKNDGGAEISEQLNLQDRPEFHGVWGKYQEGYNPENARDRDSFLTASFNQLQARFNQLQANVRAKPLRKENTEPPRSSKIDHGVVKGASLSASVLRLAELDLLGVSVLHLRTKFVETAEQSSRPFQKASVH